MKLRSTMIGLFAIVAVCGGMLFLVDSFFSRDAQMRDAEMAYQNAHADEIEARRRAFAARHAATANDGIAYSQAANGPGADEELSLDEWYANAGRNEEPFDPAPEDNSWLINSAEPFD